MQQISDHSQVKINNWGLMMQWLQQKWNNQIGSEMGWECSKWASRLDKHNKREVRDFCCLTTSNKRTRGGRRQSKLTGRGRMNYCTGLSWILVLYFLPVKRVISPATASLVVAASLAALSDAQIRGATRAILHPRFLVIEVPTFNQRLETILCFEGTINLNELSR